MNLRSALLAFAWLLVAAAFAIYYLGTKDTCDHFLEGTPLRATVVKVRTGDRPAVVLKYTDPQGKPVETTSELVGDADLKLKPGDAVEALRHKNSPSRVALKSAALAEQPSPLIFLGTAAFLALAVYTLFLPKIRAARRAKRTSGVDVIVESLARTRTTTLAVGLGIAAFGGFLVWLGASGVDKTASAGTNIACAVFGGFCALLGLFIASRAWELRSIRGSWIMRTIEERPGEMAWIYEQVITTRGAGEASATHSVFIWFADGRSYTISVEREDARALIDELRRRAPQAIVGFSAENEQRYKSRIAAPRAA